ncbi:pentapeptide repeat-containing protein [Phormidium pseudopriestleyi FRX01]|uniref:Pentapeptide repeat-containing protein n=1 Tax=Phormidium pseudopriestleyi FRX01 TaxID=1759528 RepID=A0ABS3FRY3_9CYAN|nr:pentapeptide repeat-containing protein [Phormidium pseudopriestleyi]MBO0349875.1 pentapeptide repeat-containing protein [Phormidium pseudopriestleyi FRX01]
MDIVKQDKRQSTRYMGANWQGMPPPVSLKPNDTLICCDLRNSQLDGLDLSGVEFFGCRLNGTSFRAAILRETRFIGCFSSDEASPTDFSNSILENIRFECSHINFKDPTLAESLWGDLLMVSDLLDPRYPIGKWPIEVAEVATQTLSARNDIRYEAAIALGELNNPVVTPLLGCLLADPEWEVRSVGLQVLANLRQEQFFQRDRCLLEWMFFRLGDEHSIVRYTALELVESILPPDDILLTAIEQIMRGSFAEQQVSLRSVIRVCETDRYSQLLKRLDQFVLPVIYKMMAGSAEDQLAGLYAAIDLCAIDKIYYRLIDRHIIKSLQSSEDAEVQEQASELRQLMSNPYIFPGLLQNYSEFKQKTTGGQELAELLKTLKRDHQEELSYHITKYKVEPSKIWKTMPPKRPHLINQRPWLR